MTGRGSNGILRHMWSEGWLSYSRGGVVKGTFKPGTKDRFPLMYISLAWKSAAGLEEEVTALTCDACKGEG